MPRMTAGSSPATAPAGPPVELAVLAAAGVPVPAGLAGRRVGGVSQDSRTVRPGDLYLARPGERDHGASFAAAAAAAGAAAALTDAAGAARCRAAGLPTLVVPDVALVAGPVSAAVYGHPAAAFHLVGVTGTNGKTTTTYLVDAVLRAAGWSTGLVGTVQTRVGEQVSRSARTTPEAPDLQALFARMRAAGCRAVTMEVSSHALALHRVDGTVFDAAAFTNLSQDHLELHGDVESYFAAKARLFEPGRARRAVVDVDDAYGARLAAGLSIPVTRVSPSGRDTAAFRPRDLRFDARGDARFAAVGPDGRSRGRVRLAIPGGFNVANALVALALVDDLGLPVEAVLAGLATATVPGRMERVGAGPDDPVVLVDFAHTPAAVASAVAAARAFTTGRLITVLGCGGDRDHEKRPLMGAAAAAAAHLLVVTDDNPRSEDPAAIRAAVVAGAATVPAGGRAQLVEVGDRAAAITFAVRAAASRDTVLVLGKGHEQGQEVGGRVRPFDDREQVRAALAARHEAARAAAPAAAAGESAGQRPAGQSAGRRR